MLSLVKPGSDALERRSVVYRQPGETTSHRYRFEVVDKRRERVRRVKSDRAKQYGGGAEIVDDGGPLAGEVLALDSHITVVHGRTTRPGDGTVPAAVSEFLQDKGAYEVKL